MRLGLKRSTGLHVFILGGVMLLSPVVWGQQSNNDEGARKVKTKVAPVYPDLAKRMAVTGKVKIEVVITPEGKVKATRVIGGHPLPVTPAVDAVKEWKFNPATDETTQVIVFEFKGSDRTE